MTLVLVLALLITLTAVELVRTLRADGYGHRPPPSRWPVTGLPDRPYVLR